MIATSFIVQGHCTRKVLSILGLSSGSYYYAGSKEQLKARGIKPCTTTLKLVGGEVDNSIIVEAIKVLLAKEFVDYGYFKVYHYLKRSYVINHKKFTV